jgi:hypothetical protein
MKWKCHLKSFQAVCLFSLLSCCFVSSALAEGFTPGSQLPKFTLPAPDSAQAQNYLGLKTMGPFSLSDVRSKIIIIEFLNAT